MSGSVRCNPKSREAQASPAVPVPAWHWHKPVDSARDGGLWCAPSPFFNPSETEVNHNLHNGPLPGPP